MWTQSAQYKNNKVNKMDTQPWTQWTLPFHSQIRHYQLSAGIKFQEKKKSIVLYRV